MNVPDWCGQPLIAGEWRDLTGAEAREMIDAVRSAAFDRRGDLVRDDAIERLRVLPLACYPGALLVEAQGRIGERTGLSNYLHGPWGLVTLTGGSEVIHDLNDEVGIALDTEEKARAYHALFCNAVRGDDGRFQTITDPNDLLWYGAPEDAIFAAITIGVRIERGENGWMIELPVAYAGTMFVARFELTENGMIEMVDDEPIAEDMPIALESWRAQFRFPPLCGVA